MSKMFGFVVRLLILMSFICAGLGCYKCFIDPDDSVRLCWGHILSKYNIRNIDACFKTLDRIFNNNPDVTKAAKVGRGYDTILKEIMRAEIMPIVEEFHQNMNNDTVYEVRLQAAADTFITMATGLPRASGCFPPCGFQAHGTVYNCMTCQYDSCEFPLDCPLQEITVGENNRTQMWCHVPFVLPSDIQIVWRYAEIKTMLMDRFAEVTAGTDKLFSIPLARLEHSGTYQCEIFSQERSLVRIYYHLTVVPYEVVGHAELQDVFEKALLPAGQFLLLPSIPPFSLLRLPSPELLTVCLASLLLLLFLTLGALYWWPSKKMDCEPEQEREPHRNTYTLQTV